MGFPRDKVDCKQGKMVELRAMIKEERKAGAIVDVETPTVKRLVETCLAQLLVLVKMLVEAAGVAKVAKEAEKMEEVLRMRLAKQVPPNVSGAEEFFPPQNGRL